MKYCFGSFFLCLALAAAVTAGVTTDTLAEKAGATSTAIVVEPVNITDSFVRLKTVHFVSDVTGDLAIRIAAAVAPALIGSDLGQPVSAEQEDMLALCAGSAGLAGCTTTPAAGVLDGNPVNGISVGAIDAQAEGTSVDVTIAYN